MIALFQRIQTSCETCRISDCLELEWLPFHGRSQRTGGGAEKLLLPQTSSGKLHAVSPLTRPAPTLTKGGHYKFPRGLEGITPIHLRLIPLDQYQSIAVTQRVDQLYDRRL
jgi:hypothetical protein